MSSLLINPFRSLCIALYLRFADQELEKEFLADYFIQTLEHQRAGLGVGFFLYAVFGVLDAFIIPDARETAWLIRFAVVCPSVLLVFLLSFLPKFLPYLHCSVAVTGLLAGAGIVGMCAAADPPGSYLYYAGLLLCSSFYFTFFQLRFFTATLIGWTVFLIYEVTALWIAPIPANVLINNTFFFISFNITGMAASYTIEHFRRMAYLQRQTIRRQTHQLHAALDEIETRRAAAEDAARHDPLTGLYNRRFFFSLPLSIHLPAAVLLIDLDHFKQINDTLGHPVGDEVLVSVARIIGDEIRETDDACRYGGEEFAVLLPRTDGEAAQRVGERLLERLRAEAIQTSKGPAQVTASIGAAAGQSGEIITLEELIVRADRALYAAKRAGRNRLIGWHKDM